MFSLGQVIFTSPGFFKTPMNSPVYSDWAYFHQLHALMEVIGRKHGRQTICHSVIPYSKQSACPLQPMNSLDSPEHSNPLREFLSYLSPTACSDVWSPDKDDIDTKLSPPPSPKTLDMDIDHERMHAQDSDNDSALDRLGCSSPSNRVFSKSNSAERSDKTHVAKKKQNRKLHWRPVQVSLRAPCISEFISSLKSGNDGIAIIGDKLNRKNKLSMEVVSVYKCGGFRRYGCSYSLKVVEHLGEGNNCTVFETGEHFHASVQKSLAGIPQHLKPHLHDGFQVCSKPGKVYRKMKKVEPFSKVTKRQVQQAMVYMRKKDGSVLKQNTIGFLHEWLENHELSTDSEMHIVGVLPGWVATGPTNIEDSTVEVHFVITTKRLLYRLVEQAGCEFGQFVSVDGTYSLLESGFPVLKLGTVDAMHKYGDVCWCVSRHEDEGAFAKMLVSVKDAVLLFFNFVVRPVCSVPDKARSIYNAFSTTFPAFEEYIGIIIAICYFHNKQAIETNKAKFSCELRRLSFSKDVEKLHSLTSSEAVENARALFEKKWTRKEKQATTWYMKEWGYTLFHASATPVGAPVANSVIESSNHEMKVNVTDHERLAMGNFLSRAVDEIGFQSTEAENFPLSLVVKNDRQRFGFAQLWLKATKKFIRESTGGNTSKVCYVPSSEFLESVTNPSLQQLRDGIWNYKNKNIIEGENFDAYIHRVTSFYTCKPLSSPRNQQNFYDCSCPYYWKYATCKHSLGLSIWKGLVCVPGNYNVSTIEQLKKRGRPKKVSNFMNKQN